MTKEISYHKGSIKCTRSLSTICRRAESKDLFGAEDEDTILAGLFEKATALLFEKAATLLEVDRSKLPTGRDCRESTSSSPEDAMEHLLCELNGSRS